MIAIFVLYWGRKGGFYSRRFSFWLSWIEEALKKGVGKVKRGQLAKDVKGVWGEKKDGAGL